eukprot:GHVO01038333.1.p2 GENE.GHVO01038333.1~~GHVO01038333.1.p2  ORF type:complete len:228 (-),score=8.84 GHVO01038333.1:504-1187(-)
MAKYARGKKSYAISDRSGLRVKYTQLKTTWDGLRVSPEDWEPKQPQLTPAKNVVDATALFNGRPDTDPENVVVYIGYTQDWTVDPRLLPGVGTSGFGHIGYVSLAMSSVPSPSGLGGTGEIGTETFETETGTLTGVAGTGAIGVEIPAAFAIGVSANGGTGAVGVEALNLSIDEAGVAGTGAVGAEALILSIAEAGVAGTGAVGNESISISEAGWGGGDWSEGTWGN